jgi:hypothetical protein
MRPIQGGEYFMSSRDFGRPGDLVRFSEMGEDREERIQRERCWQCRKHSLVFYTTRGGFDVEVCLNKCGPRGLGNRFSF